MPGSTSRAPTGCGPSEARRGSRMWGCDAFAQGLELEENSSTGRDTAYKGGSSLGRRTRLAEKPVVEAAPDAVDRFELTKRALEQRIRQQEILAELGVLALRGVPFRRAEPADLAAGRRRNERGTIQGARISAGGECLPGPRRGRMGRRRRRRRDGRRRSGIPGRICAADRQAGDIQPPRQGGPVPHAAAPARAWRPSRRQCHPAGGWGALWGPGGG